MKRVVFLGGKEIGYFCLSYLLANRASLNIEVVGVLTSNKSVSSSDFSFPDLCKQHGTPIYGELDALLNLDFDILISVQYHKILKKEHIDRAKQIAVNLHMAPLPEYRGCNQFSFAIIDDAKEFGTSLHILDVSIDGGDLLFEKRFEIPNNVFVSELYELTFELSKELFIHNVWKIIKNEIERIPQSMLPQDRNRGFHLRKEINDIKGISSSWPVEKQKRYFRATYFPPFAPPVVAETNEELSLEWYNSL